MKYGACRTLTKNGNSYTVVIPPLIRRALHLSKGSPLQLVYDNESASITITHADPRVRGETFSGVPLPFDDAT